MASLEPSPNPVLKETAELTWTIDEFAQVRENVMSPVFSTPNSDNQFYLLLDFFDTENNSQIMLSLLYNGPKEESRFYFRYSILDAGGVKHHTRGHLWEYNKFHSDHKFDLTFYKSRDKCAELLVNGSLKIYCKVKFQNSVPSPPSLFNSFGNLAENYETLLKSGKFSDFMVQIGDEVFNLHKTVLAARSPALAAMFEHEKTKELKEVEIDDMQVEVFELMVLYIYTGRLEKLKENAAELFVAADMYQLDHLKSICEQSLISSLTTESVCGDLLFADMHNAEQLKSECIEYVVEHAKEVLQTEGWKQLAKSKRNDLTAELFEKLINSFEDD